MCIKRTKLWLLAGLVLLCSHGTSTAQHSILPESSLDALTPYDAQWFKPFDAYDYGNRRGGNSGFFGSYDALFWAMTAPETVEIGADLGTVAVVEPSGLFDGTGALDFVQNTANTGFIRSELSAGHRLELGYMDDTSGWVFNWTDVGPQTNEIWNSNYLVLFTNGYQDFFDLDSDGFDDDVNMNNVYGRDGADLMEPNPAPPPAEIPGQDGIPDTPAPPDLGDRYLVAPRFDAHLRVTQEMWGTEIMRTYRCHPLHGGCQWDIGFGPRYIKFREEYMFSGYSIGYGDTMWEDEIDNEILGAQMAIRCFKYSGRFRFEAQFKGVAACNFINADQVGRTGSIYTDDFFIGGSLTPRSYDYGYHDTAFTPVGEFTFAATCNITQAISIRAGYTGMYMRGIARPTTLHIYDIDTMGLKMGGDYEDVYIGGGFVGLEINR